MNNNILELKDAWKTYEIGNGRVHALKSFNYAFKEGSFNIIFGPSGSGKSTLIRVSGLLEKPTKGKILINRRDFNHLSEKERASFIRNEIGFIFKNSNLIPSLTVLENVMLHMISSDQERAKEILQRVKFNEFNKFPEELSFKEHQKVTIARSIINSPSLILADEPTGELHTKEANEIMNLLLYLNKEEKITIIMTTNNRSLSKFAENLIEIKDGTNIS